MECGSPGSGATALWARFPPSSSRPQAPDAVARVHRSFVKAGCHVLSTASYQATYQGFAAHLGLDHEAVSDLLRSSVALARSACAGHDVLVAASIGPYGAYLADGSECARAGCWVAALFCQQRR